MQMATQEQLFTSRRAALRADLQAMQEGIDGQEAMIQSYQRPAREPARAAGLAARSWRTRAGWCRKAMRRAIASSNWSGWWPRCRAPSWSCWATLSAPSAPSPSCGKGRRCAGRSTARRSRGSSPTSRAMSRPTRASTARCARSWRVEIKSPASGQVVGLAVQTVGAVVSPGQKLMDIVPEGELLLLESKVPPHLIDRVHAGLPVDVRFAAFAHSPQLVVDGQLVSVSGDLLTEPQTNVTYYLARVELTPEGLRKLGTRSLQPGMPVEVVLHTGERSLLTYLLHPLTKRLAASMKEE